MVGSHYCPSIISATMEYTWENSQQNRLLHTAKPTPKKYSDGEGLYFCIRKQDSPYWMIRYTTPRL